MDFEAYWNSLAMRNPGLRDERMRITMKLDEFKRVLQLSFDAGTTEGAPRTSDFPEALRGLFGGRL